MDGVRGLGEVGGVGVRAVDGVGGTGVVNGVVTGAVMGLRRSR